MWATLALSAALNLAPAQAGGLEFKNVRTTYSILGQERKDSDLLPGDVYVVHFDVDGLSTKADGRVLYSMGMELTRAGKDKPEFRKAPQNLEVVNSLGGSQLPLYALSVIGTDTPPGKYTLKLTFQDRISNKKAELTRNFQVIKPRLGFVRLGLTYETGQPAPSLAVPGQTLLLNFSLVGFDLDKMKHPNVSVSMQILDDRDKPTVQTPFTGDVKKVAKDFQQIIPFDAIRLVLNRPGKFKVKLTATDNLAKKTVEQTLDLTVLGAK
jgi:hypothetical protein